VWCVYVYACVCVYVSLCAKGPLPPLSDRYLHTYCCNPPLTSIPAGRATHVLTWIKSSAKNNILLLGDWICPCHGDADAVGTPPAIAATRAPAPLAQVDRGGAALSAGGGVVGAPEEVDRGRRSLRLQSSVPSEQCIKNAAYLPPPKPKTQPKAARSIFDIPTGSSGDDVDGRKK
jgi:hypothetical protein